MNTKAPEPTPFQRAWAGTKALFNRFAEEVAANHPKYEQAAEVPEKDYPMVERISGEEWPSLVVSKKAHGKMWSLIMLCRESEISWMGACVRLSDGSILLEDIFVPKQECTAVTTTITREGDQQLLQELLNKGDMDAINRIRCWGHSHVDMPVFASYVDEEQTRSFLKRYDDFFVRCILNRKGELYCSIYLLDTGVVIHHPVVKEEIPDTEGWLEWAQKEIAEKVTRTDMWREHSRRRSAYRPRTPRKKKENVDAEA